MERKKKVYVNTNFKRSPHPFLGAQDNAGNIKDDSKCHFPNLAQLLLLIGHADGDGVDQHEGVHAFGAVLFTVEHSRAGLAAGLVAWQQEGT